MTFGDHMVDGVFAIVAGMVTLFEGEAWIGPAFRRPSLFEAASLR